MTYIPKSKHQHHLIEWYDKHGDDIVYSFWNLLLACFLFMIVILPYKDTDTFSFTVKWIFNPILTAYTFSMVLAMFSENLRNRLTSFNTIHLIVVVLSFTFSIMLIVAFPTLEKLYSDKPEMMMLLAGMTGLYMMFTAVLLSYQPITFKEADNP